MMRIVIIGGGFMGQLLQVLLPRARVLDWQSKAPAVQNRTLGAQYLWEPVPEVECRQFDVLTTIDGEDATFSKIMAYKKKVGKEQDAADWRSQFEPRMPGFEITKMPPPRVEYGMRVAGINHHSKMLYMSNRLEIRYDIVLSTVPLPFMAGLAGFQFNPQSRPIYVQTTQAEDVGPNWYVNYNAGPDPVYRTTHRDGLMHHEALDPVKSSEDSWRKIIPGKIYRDVTASSVRDMLAARDIYTFGRFASWEPEELAHETMRFARAAIAAGGWA